MTIREELDFDLILDKINNIFLKNHLTYIECLGLLDLMKEIILDEFRNGEKRMTNKTKEIQFNKIEIWIISIALGIIPIVLLLCFFYIWSL